MQRVEYQPLIVGKEPVDEPKSCHYSFQDVTFVISLVVQLAVLIFSLVTLGIGNPPPLLQLILVLETVVQGVEFLWYATIGALYFFRKMTFGVEYRYIDWVITTPIMLLSLFFLVIYFGSPCMEVAKLVDFPGFAGLLVLIVLADWAMLFLGCMVEANWWNIRERVSYVRWLLVLGFVPLCLAFIAHIMAATERPSDSAVAVIVPTFILWSLYGVVAIAAYGDDRAQWRNAFYNLLGKSTARPLSIAMHSRSPPSAPLQICSRRTSRGS
jgi:bacteriorhodopsin